jgi:hypothetical protein
MAYREITMIEIKEILRRWVSGIPKKRLAAQLGLDPKTVVLSLEPDDKGVRRRKKAFIFTPNVSRYRFVYRSGELANCSLVLFSPAAAASRTRAAS